MSWRILLSLGYELNKFILVHGLNENILVFKNLNFMNIRVDAWVYLGMIVNLVKWRFYLRSKWSIYTNIYIKILIAQRLVIQMNLRDCSIYLWLMIFEQVARLRERSAFPFLNKQLIGRTFQALVKLQIVKYFVLPWLALPAHWERFLIRPHPLRDWPFKLEIIEIVNTHHFIQWLFLLLWSSVVFELTHKESGVYS